MAAPRSNINSRLVFGRFTLFSLIVLVNGLADYCPLAGGLKADCISASSRRIDMSGGYRSEMAFVAREYAVWTAFFLAEQCLGKGRHVKMRRLCRPITVLAVSARRMPA
jgi:hypothetical protein